MTDSNNITALAYETQIRKWQRAIEANDDRAIRKYQRRAFFGAMVMLQRTGVRAETKEPDTLAYMMA